MILTLVIGLMLASVTSRKTIRNILSSKKVKIPVQSPRGLNVDSAIPISKSILDIKYDEIEGEFEYEEGHHTYKMGIPKNNFKYEVVYAGNSYFLRNIHIHTPQEHQVNGKEYPSEFHFVHSRKNPTKGEFNNLVLGVFGNPVADEKASKDFKGISWKGQSRINLEDLKTSPYFHYKGSLTTPSYDENVNWFVFPKPKNIKKSLINVAHSKIGNNNRKLQTHKGLVVYFKGSRKSSE